jgi:hypothetical protein
MTTVSNLSVCAHLSLSEAAFPERSFRMPSPTHSFLYRFRTGTDDEVLAGAQLAVDGGRAVVPGKEVSGVLQFWADEIEMFLRPGKQFDIWYGGDVGAGTIDQDQE